MRRMTTPFAFANYVGLIQHFPNLFWVVTVSKKWSQTYLDGVFFGFGTHSERYFSQLPSKREFFKVTYLTLRGLKKIFTHRHDAK